MTLWLSKGQVRVWGLRWGKRGLSDGSPSLGFESTCLFSCSLPVNCFSQVHPAVSNETSGLFLHSIISSGTSLSVRSRVDELGAACEESPLSVPGNSPEVSNLLVLLFLVLPFGCFYYKCPKYCSGFATFLSSFLALSHSHLCSHFSGDFLQTDFQGHS